MLACGRGPVFESSRCAVGNKTIEKEEGPVSSRVPWQPLRRVSATELACVRATKICGSFFNRSQPYHLHVVSERAMNASSVSH
jgi:hypothetical protein